MHRGAVPLEQVAAGPEKQAKTERNVMLVTGAITAALAVVGLFVVKNRVGDLT